MVSSFRHCRRVEFCETDMAGIVHFSNYFRWMEQAEHEFFRSLGLTIADTRADGSTIGWPRVSVSCRYLGPTRFEDELTVEIRIQRIGVKSLTFDVLIYRGSDNSEPVAKGVMKTVCCVLEPGQAMKSVEIPVEYRSLFEEFQ